MKLAQLQQAFGDMLLGQAASISEAIVDGQPGQMARLHVYRNHFLVSLQEAIHATYPRCRQFLGDAVFRELARSFVLRYPPQDCCMVNYGAGFADYLADVSGLENATITADLARLEWQMERSSLQAQVTTFPFERLGTVNPDDYEALVLRPAASLRMWEASCAVDVLFDALVDEQTPLMIDPERICLVALHRDQGVALSRLTPTERSILTLCFEEQPLAAYSGGLDEAVMAELAAMLGRGLIEDFSLRR